MLIGITGKAGSGKNTVADFLVENYSFKCYAFADAVRETACSINPIIMTNWQTNVEKDTLKLEELRLVDVVSVHGWDKAKREMPEVRRLLQVIGTEAGRNIMGEDVWVDILAKKWEDDGRPDAVVTDMRFPNEVAWVEAVVEGVTVEVDRPNNPNAIVTSHASEAYNFDCEYILHNEGTVQDLQEQIVWMMEDLQAHDGQRSA